MDRLFHSHFNRAMVGIPLALAILDILGWRGASTAFVVFILCVAFILTTLCLLVCLEDVWEWPKVILGRVKHPPGSWKLLKKYFPDAGKVLELEVRGSVTGLPYTIRHGSFILLRGYGGLCLRPAKGWDMATPQEEILTKALWIKYDEKSVLETAYLAAPQHNDSNAMYHIFLEKNNIQRKT